MVWEFPPVNWMARSTRSLSSQTIGLMAECMQEEDKASLVPEVVGCSSLLTGNEVTPLQVVPIYLQELQQQSSLGWSKTLKVFRFSYSVYSNFLSLSLFLAWNVWQLLQYQDCGKPWTIPRLLTLKRQSPWAFLTLYNCKLHMLPSTSTPYNFILLSIIQININFVWIQFCVEPVHMSRCSNGHLAVWRSFAPIWKLIVK